MEEKKKEKTETSEKKEKSMVRFSFSPKQLFSLSCLLKRFEKPDSAVNCLCSSIH